MAFEANGFRTRTVTAIFFVGIMLLGLMFNHFSYFILVLVLFMGSWFEIQNIVLLVSKDYFVNSPPLIFFSGLPAFSLLLADSGAFKDVGMVVPNKVILVFLVVLFLAFFLFVLLKQKRMQPIPWLWFVLSLLYVPFSLSFLFRLWDFPLENITAVDKLSSCYKQPYLFPLFIIVSIWLNDTFQYLVGSIIGKTPFSSISPNKTWEGTIGGSLVTVLIIGLFGHFELRFSPLFAMVLPMTIVLMGTLGDLAESKLKRMAKVKDSGNIMPGHGGFLDRFDSLLLALPFSYACLILFQKGL